MMSAEDEWPDLAIRDHSPESIRDWISTITRRLATTPTELARKGGLAPSTVNRFLSGTGANKNVSASTLNALVSAARQIAVETGALEDIALRPPKRHVATPRTNGITVSPILVKGKVEAGVFQEATEWEFDDQYIVEIPLGQKYASNIVVGLEVHGPSMNKVYPEGTIVACVAFRELDRPPISGERVVVERREGPGGVETTVKEFFVDPNENAWLVPLSTHEDHKKPLFLGPLPKEHENGPDGHVDGHVIVTHLVIGSYRPEPDLTVRK